MARSSACPAQQISLVCTCQGFTCASRTVQGIKPLLGTIASPWHTRSDHARFRIRTGVRISPREKPRKLPRRGSSQIPHQGMPAATPASKGGKQPTPSHSSATYKQQGARGGGRRTERKGEKWLTVMKSINHAVINNLIILENCGFFLTKKHLNTTAVNNPTLYPYFWGLKIWQNWISPMEDISSCHESIYLNTVKTCTPRKIHILTHSNITMWFLQSS